jgi:CRISPR/Cas system-associated protein Cas5 (RAMP superfamily)
MFELNYKGLCYIESAVKNDLGAYGIINAMDNRNASKAWSLLKTKYDKTGDSVDMT